MFVEIGFEVGTVHGSRIGENANFVPRTKWPQTSTDFGGSCDHVLDEIPVFGSINDGNVKLGGFGVRFLQFVHVGCHFDSEVNFVGILTNNLKLDVLGFSVLISHVGCFRIEGLSSINDLNSTSLTRKPAKWVASLKYGGINNKYDRVTRYQACNDAIWKLLLKCAKTLSKSADYGAKEPNWRISIWDFRMPICIRKYSFHLDNSSDSNNSKIALM